jgi:ABC-2 type transport system permease protein
MSARAQLASTWVLMRRAINEVVRVPGAAIPGVLAPTIFMIGLTAVFGNLTELNGFTGDSFVSFILPVSMMQGAGFTGAATGVNLARDIELGWFDRLLVAPPPRYVLLAGTVLSAGLRALMPMSLLLVVGFALGAHFPGLPALLIAVFCSAVFGSVAACYACGIALRFKSQASGILMQSVTFMAVLFTPAYAPQELLTGWLYHVAKYNPVTQIIEAVRQGFVGDVTWANTWPGLVALFGLGAAMALFALRQMEHTTE